MRHSRKQRSPGMRLLGLIVLLQAAAFAACGDSSVEVQTHPPQTISVTPDQLTLAVGESARVVATVSGGAPGTSRDVRFASSSPSSATVSEDGLVTGIAPGETTIIARAAADESVRAEVGVTVVEGEPAAAIAIQSITRTDPATGDQVPADADAIAGTIVVTLAADIPDAGVVASIELWLGDVLVSSQAVGEAAAALEDGGTIAGALSDVVASVETDAFDPSEIPAIVRHTNGQHALRALLLSPDGDVVAEDEENLILDNADAFHGIVSVPSSAVSEAGHLWHGGGPGDAGLACSPQCGALTVTANPVMYSGQVVDEVVIGFGASTRTAGAGTDFTGVFPVGEGATPGAPGHGVQNVETGLEGMAPTVSSTLTAGGSGPDSFINTGDAELGDADFPDPATGLPRLFAAEGGVWVRLDNLLTSPGTFVLPDQYTGLDASGDYRDQPCCANNGVGREHWFAAFAIGQADAGVGLDPDRATTPEGANTQVFAGPAGATVAALLGTAPVVFGLDLTPTSANTAYRAVAVPRDRLGNRPTTSDGAPTVVPLAPTGPTGPGAFPVPFGLNPGTHADGHAVFGVDHVDPQASYTQGASVVANARLQANAAFQYALTVTDNSAGISTLPLVGRVERLRDGLSAEDRCVIGAFSAANGVCRPIGMQDAVVIPIASADGDPAAAPGVPPGPARRVVTDGDGQFHLAATLVQDRAGNRTVVPERRVVRDATAPAVDDQTLTPGPTGGQPISYSFSASDNVEVEDYDLGLFFPAPVQAPGVIPLLSRVPLGTAFDDELVSSVDVTRSFPYIRHLEATDFGGAPQGDMTAPSLGIMRVRNSSRLEVMNASALSNPQAPGASAAALGLNTWLMVAPSATTLCNNEAGVVCGAGVPTERTLTFRATSAVSPFDQPFNIVVFYRVDTSGHARMIGFSRDAEAVLFPTAWEWSIVFDATGLAPDAAANVFAIGVAVGGGALRSPNTPFDIQGPALGNNGLNP
jgi:hypothetical protein